MKRMERGKEMGQEKEADDERAIGTVREGNGRRKRAKEGKL